MYDVIIIGGGPAGISAGLYAFRAGMKTLIIENGHGALKKAHLIQNYYGQTLSGVALYEQGLEQARALGIEILHDEVVGAEWLLTFNVQVASREEALTAKSLVLATGTQQASVNIPGLKAYEGKGVSYCAVCDGFFFREKNVAVLGNGAYALHEANYLKNLANVTILTNGEELESALPTITQKIVGLRGDNSLQAIDFADGSSINVAGLFVAFGSAGSSSFALKLGAVQEGPHIKVDEHASTNVPGLFAAGDCTGGLLQVAKAVHEGAEAGLAAVKFVKAKN
ncbi:MAG: FAD-dependent oxidoreductase [Phascolarctobacterium sp.]|nr:FAD-dependent oxidoreductase [Phascolarctobacterium sp.]